MPFLLLLSLIALPFASEAKLNLKPQPQKLEDPGSATPFLYKKEGPGELPNRGNVGAGCTNSLGVTVKKGDRGFDACLNELNRSRAKNANEKSPHSVGITIGN